MKKKKAATIISRITTWILRITVVVTIFFFVTVMLAAMLSGNGEAQKAALEQTFSSLFHRPAKIQKLNTYELFPTLIADFDNMVVLDDAEDEPLVILERGRYVHDPIQRFTGGEPVISVEVKNFLTAPGYWGPYSLHIAKAMIDPQPDPMRDGPHQASAIGNYGGHPISVHFPLMGRVHGGQMQYRFVGEEPIMIKLDGMEIKATMTVNGQALVFDPVNIALDDTRLSGTFILPGLKTPEEPVQKQPVLKLIDSASGITIDGEISEFSKTVKFSGKLTGDTISVQSLRANDGAIVKILGKVMSILVTSKQKNLRGSVVPPGTVDISLDLSIAALQACKTFDHLEGRLRFDGKALSLSDLKWQINGENYSGVADGKNLTLKAEKNGKADPTIANCFY